MKVSKVQSQDIGTLYHIVDLIESVENYGEIPYKEDYTGERVPEIGLGELDRAFDARKDDYVSDEVNYFIRQAFKRLIDLAKSGNTRRALLNLETLIDPQNEIIDQESETLEEHPKIKQAMLDTKRLEWLFDYGLSEAGKGRMGCDVTRENFRERIDERIPLTAMLK